MREFWHVILEALIDTAKILPLLFVIYYLIELFEHKFAMKWQRNKLLQGKASPVIGAGMGCVPQCGFSIISTDLFAKGKLSIGALIAVYIATSDEAIPLMIANPNKIGWLFALLGAKLVIGIVVGYLSIALYKVFFKKQNTKKVSKQTQEHEEEIEHGGCCHHHVEAKSFDWLHPMLHCLKISLFILIINILLGCVTHLWIGEDTLKTFLNNSIWLQPVLAVLIGLVPNCVASVCITELALGGGLTFGAMIAGLCVNAGLGLIFLLKQNKNKLENIFILIMLIVPSIIIGYALTPIGFI